MTHSLTLLLCVLAFAALALALERHQGAVLGRLLPARISRALRWTGWCGLALALCVIVHRQGYALGLVSYSGHTSLAAGLVYVALIAVERRRGRR